MTDAVLPLPVLHRPARRRLSCPAAMVVVAAAALLGWQALRWGPVPLQGTAQSPLLQQIQARGVLQAAVRMYPRPSLPDAPLPPEPDVLDLAYAQWLATQAGVTLQLVAHSSAHVQLQGDAFHASSSSAPPTAFSTGYGASQVQLVVLRQQLPRWQRFAPSVPQRLAARWPALAALWPAAAAPHSASRAPTVCVGHGAVPLAALQGFGLQTVVARSSIHAISNFLAGQCDALAEDPALIQRLLAQPAWRFYTVLGQPWSTAAARATADPSDPWLHSAQQHWQRSAQRQRALHNRTSTVVLEASLLEDGAICH